MKTEDRDVLFQRLNEGSMDHERVVAVLLEFALQCHYEVQTRVI